MNIEEYQEKAWRTVNKELEIGELLANMIVGIFGESGEVADIVKKHLYQGHGLDIDHVEEELGDVMWYIANLCNLLGIKIENVLEGNYKKLVDRFPDGFSEERSVNRER